MSIRSVHCPLRTIYCSLLTAHYIKNKTLYFLWVCPKNNVILRCYLCSLAKSIFFETNIYYRNQSLSVARPCFWSDRTAYIAY